MSMRPEDEPWGTRASEQGELYGQPFDPAVSNPEQQPPPPGWEQGTWTAHAGQADVGGGGQVWLIVAVAALCMLVIAVVVVMLA